MLNRSWTTLLITLSLLGCDSRTSSDSSPDSPDFAAYKVRLNSAPDTIRTAEVGSVGSANGEDEQSLYRVYSGFLDHADRLYLAHGGGSEIREYTRTGQFVRAFGREGRGPGEFVRLRFITPLGPDSILAYDSGLSRFSVFDKAGSFHRSFTVSQIGLRGRQPTWMGTSRRGDLLLSVTSGLPSVAMYEGVTARDSVRLLRVDREGAVLDSIAEVPNQWWRSLPSTDAFHLAAVEEGPAAVVAANDSILLYTANDAPVIELVELHGPGRRRWELPAIAPVRNSDLPPEYGRRFFEQIVLSDSGQIWVSEAAVTPDGNRVWHQLSLHGRETAVALLPQSLRLLDIRGSTALSRMVDTLGVEYIKVLELRE